MTAFSQTENKQNQWPAIVIYTLGFWLSATIVIDFVIMPTLFVAGMMTQPNFASAGYSIFWVFNRIELVCAALIVTGSLVSFNFDKNWNRIVLVLSLLLLGISLIDTYALTPTMSAMGMQLNLFEPANIPVGMASMHQSYWVLEVIKLLAAGTLLNFGLKKLQ